MSKKQQLHCQQGQLASDYKQAEAGGQYGRAAGLRQFALSQGSLAP